MKQANEKYLTNTMKSKDISDNMQRFEKKKQYQTEQKLKEIDERNKKLEKIKQQKEELNQTIRKF